MTETCSILRTTEQNGFPSRTPAYRLFIADEFVVIDGQNIHSSFCKQIGEKNLKGSDGDVQQSE
jgi:hypothetical protein